MVNSTLIKSFFIMPPGDNIYILWRIEFLVALSTLLFLGMSVLDIFRSHFHSSSIKGVLSIVDCVSDSLVLYVMGAMQTAPFKNQLFPVWAIVLVSFRYSSDFITGYGIRDKQGRRFTEWRNMVKLLGVAFLNKTRGSMFAYPLWWLWGLLMARGVYRLVSRNLAFNAVWHGKSSQVVSEFMRTDTKFENFKLQDCKADTMQGYKYLVYGETNKHLLFNKPRYILQIDSNPRKTRDKARALAQAKRKAKAKGTTAQAQREGGTGPAKALPDSLITLDKIWQCDGALLNPGSTHGNKFKDLSLAFSLSRLLRCRLEDVSLHKDSIPITKNLVLLRIIQEEAKRAFGVMELEMSFLNDYFNTRYPMVFWGGLKSLHLSLVLSAFTFIAACWLSVDIRRVYKTPTDQVSHMIHGVNIDMIITWGFMFFMAFREIWEMASYYLSDWARLLLASAYVRWNGKWLMRNCCMEKFISSFFTSKIASKKWHGVLDQFAFFQSYDYNPTYKWNLMHIPFTGAIPKKDQGAQFSDDINIPECVKLAVLATLGSMDLTRAHLPDVIPSLVDGSRERYRWACFDLPTSTHVILVWHIATSLCEIKFALDSGIKLGKPGFPLYALLYLTSSCRCCCCAPRPYLVNEDILDGVLKTKYVVANSLSRYCAYLLVSKPDLVPDSYLAPKLIFQQTVKDARRILKDCDSLEKIYKTLMQEVDMVAQDTSNSEENMNIIQQGVKLAKELMLEIEKCQKKLMSENEKCQSSSEKDEKFQCLWEILAGVWADLLVHIAPSWNAAAHKDCLDSGGEFVTHIWALLLHCGINKSMLWPVEGVPRNNATTIAPQSNHSGNNSVQLAQDERQAACAGERDGKQGMETAGGPSFVNGEGYLVRGMENLGSTCYFNAVLQSLFALSDLRIKILEQNSPEGLLHELKNIFQEVAGGANSNGAGGTMVTKTHLENLFSTMNSEYQYFKTDEMEDSNYLLVFLLGGLEKEEPTMVQSLFRGKVDEHISTKECEHSSVNNQVLDLCLAIPSKEHVSVEDCLDLYATGEVADWHCTTCSAVTAPENASSNRKDTAVEGEQNQQSESVTHPEEGSSHPAENRTSTPNQQKEKEPMLGEDERKIYRAASVKFCITKAPPILTIQLKRFDYVNPRRSDKLDEHVSFQEVLNITNFMDPRCAANGDYNYSLAAVIVHEGKELRSGHNYSYVRASSIGDEGGATHSWFCANDTNVRKASLEEVLQCQAYILFYQRVDQAVVKTNLHTQ